MSEFVLVGDVPRDADGFGSFRVVSVSAVDPDVEAAPAIVEGVLGNGRIVPGDADPVVVCPEIVEAPGSQPFAFPQRIQHQDMVVRADSGQYIDDPTFPGGCLLGRTFIVAVSEIVLGLVWVGGWFGLVEFA